MTHQPDERIVTLVRALIDELGEVATGREIVNVIASACGQEPAAIIATVNAISFAAAHDNHDHSLEFAAAYGLLVGARLVRAQEMADHAEA